MIKKLPSPCSFYQACRRVVTQFEKDVRSVSHMQKQCPPRCRYWEYLSTASFVDLAKENQSAKNLLYSRMHIFFADFLYQQQEETLAVNIYLAFCNFGNVVGFYLGLSIVGIFEVIFWFSNFLVAIARVRCPKHEKIQKSVSTAPIRVKRIRHVQVAPV